MRKYVVMFAIITAIGIILYQRVAYEPKQDKVIEVQFVSDVDPVSVYVPPKVSDVRLARLVNRAISIDERIGTEISSTIPNVTNTHDQNILLAVVGDVQDNDAVRNEVINLLRRSNCTRLPNALIGVLENPAEQQRFRAFAVQHLGSMDLPNDAELRQRVTRKLQESLQDRHVDVRREALLALIRRRDSIATQAAVTWLTSGDSENVRDLAIRCVVDLDLREHVPTIRKYLKDENEVVRIAAIVALSQWGDEESRPVFEQAAASNVVRLQRAGKAALERLDKVKH
jgi:hypothetical protein